MSRLMPAPSDGRRFTLYQSDGLVEDTLQRIFGTRNENMYRSFLQHNPSQVDTELQIMVQRPTVSYLPRRAYR